MSVKRKLTEYNYIVLELLYAYLHEDIEGSKLIAELEKLQNIVIIKFKGKKKALWFRFYYDDKEATTIQDIEDTLVKGLYGSKAIDLMLDRFSLALEGDLEIHYS